MRTVWNISDVASKGKGFAYLPGLVTTLSVFSAMFLLQAELASNTRIASDQFGFQQNFLFDDVRVLDTLYK